MCVFFTNKDLTCVNRETIRVLLTLMTRLLM